MSLIYCLVDLGIGQQLYTYNGLRLVFLLVLVKRRPAIAIHFLTLPLI
jgi:hypothetical protein